MSGDFFRTLPQGGESYQYDTLGRLTTSTTVQGAVTMGYDGITSRVLSVTRPAGLSTDFSYDTSNNDYRLLEILNSHDVEGLLSKHNYSYRTDGIIQSWQNQLRGRTDDEGYHFTYDRSGQLIDAVKKNLTSDAVLSTHSWLYDDAGNRLSENHNGTVQQGSFNAANQLTALDPAGPIRLTGQVNKAATSVTVDGEEAQLQPDGSFQVQVDTVAGANSLPLVVTEQGGQITNKKIEFTVQGGEALVYHYDQNGNVTSVAPAATPLAPQTTYTWNARDELVAITRNEGADTYVTEFSYNGKSQRIRRVEKTNGTPMLEETYLWLGSQIVQKRSADGSQVLTTYTGGGQQDYDLANGSAATDYFYSKDHLGSVREMVDASGVIRASYDYDVYGERVKLSGDLDCELGYTGHRYHQESGLVLTLYRAYDPKTGRWISSDPIAESGGLNLYAYVGNDPVNFVDPDGRIPQVVAAIGAYVALHGAGGSAVGAASGLIGGYIFGEPGNRGRSAAAGLVSGGIAGGAGGVGSSASTDFLGPVSIVGDFGSGYLATHLSFSINDALLGCPTDISDNRRDFRDALAVVTGIATAVSPVDAIDAGLIGISTSLGVAFVDWAAGIADN